MTYCRHEEWIDTPGGPLLGDFCKTMILTAWSESEMEPDKCVYDIGYIGHVWVMIATCAWFIGIELQSRRYFGFLLYIKQENVEFVWSEPCSVS